VADRVEPKVADRGSDRAARDKKVDEGGIGGIFASGPPALVDETKDLAPILFALLALGGIALFATSSLRRRERTRSSGPV
jgi:hypothetical protein